MIGKARSTFRSQGIKGFYPGIGIAALGAIPGTGLYFASYEKSKAILEGLTVS